MTSVTTSNQPQQQQQQHHQPVLTFSSKKCPPDCGLENSGQLPFGFLYNPFAVVSSTSPALPLSSSTSSTLDGGTATSGTTSSNTTPTTTDGYNTPIPIVPVPDLCLTCLSYRSMYSKINIKKNTWTCTICGQDLNQLLLVLSPHQQDSTNPMNNNDHVDHSRNEKTKDNNHQSLSYTHITSSVYEYKQPFVSASVHTTGIRTTHSQNFILVFDEHLSSMEAHSIILSIRDIVYERIVSHRTKYGNSSSSSSLLINMCLVLFSKSVTVYQLGVCTATTATADVIATHHGFNETRIKQRAYYITIGGGGSTSNNGNTTANNNTDTVDDDDELFHHMFDLQFEPLLTCISAQYGTNISSTSNTSSTTTTDTVESDFSSMMDKPKSRLELLKERKEARLRSKQQQQQQVDSSTSNNEKSSSSSSLKDITTSTTPIKSPWIIAKEQRKNHSQQSQQQFHHQHNYNDDKTTPIYSVPEPPYRCTGEAMECAMELAAINPLGGMNYHTNISNLSTTSTNTNDMMNSSNSQPLVHSARIFLFTNGCPNYGNGTCTKLPSNGVGVPSSNVGTFKKAHHHSVNAAYNTVDMYAMMDAAEYYNMIGHNGSECGIGIDVFCSGHQELAIPAYQALVEPSSGYVTAIDCFQQNQYELISNMKYLLFNTYVTLAQYNRSLDIRTTNQQLGIYDSNKPIVKLLGNGHDDNYNDESDSDHNDQQQQQQQPIYMDGCVVDIRLSNFVTATHLIGPGDWLTTPVTGPLLNESYAYSLGAALVNDPEFDTRLQQTQQQQQQQQNGPRIENKNNNNNTDNVVDVESGDAVLEDNTTMNSDGNSNASKLTEPRKRWSILSNKKEERNHRRKKKITIQLSDDVMESSLTRIRLGRFDPLSTFSLMMQLNENYHHYKHDSNIYIQCIVRYVNDIGTELRTIVSTYQLPIAKDLPDYIQSVNDEVVCVLLGKEAVYRAMYGRGEDQDENKNPTHLSSSSSTNQFFYNNNNQNPTNVDNMSSSLSSRHNNSNNPHLVLMDQRAYAAQRDLDETIFRISRSYRLLCLQHGTRNLEMTDEEAGPYNGKLISTGSSLNVAFPPDLVDALRKLYHMRRGPLLSPGPLQSLDDQTELRSLFLRLPVEDCLRMMSPKLFSCSSRSTTALSVPYLENVPPETLTLWSNRIIAADHFFSLFLWSGKDLVGPEYDGLRKYLKRILLELAHKRFPMPNVHMLSENDSMSRRFTSLLAPSHGDPVEHQLANFPALGSQLSFEELNQLRAKFHFYDPESDPSFRNWFWKVSSPIDSSNREVGMSLCE